MSRTAYKRDSPGNWVSLQEYENKKGLDAGEVTTQRGEVPTAWVNEMTGRVIHCAGWDWEYSEDNLEITSDDSLIVVAEGFHTDDEFFFQVESDNRCMVYGMRMFYDTDTDVVYENNSPSIEDGHTEYTYQFNQGVSDVWSAIHSFLNENDRDVPYRLCSETESGSELPRPSHSPYQQL